MKKKKRFKIKKKEILGNACAAVVRKPSSDVINFEINFSFLIKLFFLYDQNIKTKISKNILRTKRTFNMK